MSHPNLLSGAGSSPQMLLLDSDPDVLAARELIAEAHALVARSKVLIARGRKLREESEKVLEQLYKRDSQVPHRAT